MLQNYWNGPYIARYAAIADVPFQPFAEVVTKVIGDSAETALRVVLESQKELHAIEQLLPDDARTEPTPLDERVKHLMEYVSTLEQENERLRDRETAREGTGGIARDGTRSLDDLRRGRRPRQTPDEDQTGKRKEKER